MDIGILMVPKGILTKPWTNGDLQNSILITGLYTYIHTSPDKLLRHLSTRKVAKKLCLSVEVCSFMVENDTFGLCNDSVAFC